MGCERLKNCKFELWHSDAEYTVYKLGTDSAILISVVDRTP